MFFFSSRRRHTRYIGDWSSDVCSSDLDLTVGVGGSGSQLVVSNSGTVAAGTNVILGFFPAISSSNRLTVDGGTLRATNVLGTGVLDVRRGTNVLNAGLIDVDRLVITNKGTNVVRTGFGNSGTITIP